MEAKQKLSTVITLVAVVVLASFVFVACTSQSESRNETGTAGQQNISDKQGDTTLTGTIRAANGSYFIESPGETPQAIESYTVDLASYAGQYSGDTLFVGSIE